MSLPLQGWHYECMLLHLTSVWCCGLNSVLLIFVARILPTELSGSVPWFPWRVSWSILTVVCIPPHLASGIQLVFMLSDHLVPGAGSFTLPGNFFSELLLTWFPFSMILSDWAAVLFHLLRLAVGMSVFSVNSLLASLPHQTFPLLKKRETTSQML